jgi:predicted Zn-dependent protease with MMP-like domain
VRAIEATSLACAGTRALSGVQLIRGAACFILSSGMRRDDFESLVEQAWETIPESFRARFSNLTVAVEDEPRREHLAAAGVPPSHTLLGLYQGIPLSQRGWSYTMALPDQVTLFQGPIERAARSHRDIPRIVYETLWHELAHHLGMNEKEVREAERRRGVYDSDEE